MNVATSLRSPPVEARCKGELEQESERALGLRDAEIERLRRNLRGGELGLDEQVPTWVRCRARRRARTRARGPEAVPDRLARPRELRRGRSGSSGRSSALPPNATTASGRTNEKKESVTVVSRSEPLARLRESDVTLAPRTIHSSRRGARHAARPPRARTARSARRTTHLPLPHVELLAAEEQVVLVHDPVTGAAELLGRPHVAVVEKDDPGARANALAPSVHCSPPLRDGSSPPQRTGARSSPAPSTTSEGPFRSPGDLPPVRSHW
jgi:hypothetical protein